MLTVTILYKLHVPCNDQTYEIFLKGPTNALMTIH